ncbi:hypothetical protein [Actinoplanes sp. NPDC049118]|uniref:hypothetical protein n=1 Tax=Actinoplanes sp. NPDC049118 TaxID=3155769 RepID=UPI0033E6B16F
MMKPPERGATVTVMRNDAPYLELRVTSTEPGSHEGWHTIRGSVRRGSYWEPRAVYAELQDDGSVRMLSTGERLGSSSAPGSGATAAQGPRTATTATRTAGKAPDRA